MVVANDVSTDTRVRKMAHDLSAAGLEVTVLGVSRTGRKEEYELGSAKVTLLPVGDRLRIDSRLSRGFGRRHLLSHEIGVRKANYFSLQRTVSAKIGWLRTDYYRARTARNDRANKRAQRILDDRAAKEDHRAAKEQAPSQPIRPQPLALLPRITKQLERKAQKWRKQRRIWTESWFERWFKWTERFIEARLSRRHRRHLRTVERLERGLIRSIERGDKPNWRRVLPELHDYEVSFGPILDSTRPDVIHAQDVHLLGVAARATARIGATGKDTKLIYDAHEYIAGLAHPRPAKAWTALEGEYIDRAEGVITVAPAIAELLEQDYQLQERPTVVRNIPTVGSRPTRSLRQQVGIPNSQLLLVYSGGLDATRGVHTLVRALGDIPEAHLALVSKAQTGYTIALEEIARAGGYEDRLHFAPFVEPQHVVGYLESADIGVHTIISGPVNHEVTLPNKLFEYMHARLPIVISDCKSMSEFVEELGVGRAFRSEDVESLVGVLREVIANRADYVSRYEDDPDILRIHSWPAERQKLLNLYSALLGVRLSSDRFDNDRLPPMTNSRDATRPQAVSNRVTLG